MHLPKLLLPALLPLLWATSVGAQTAPQWSRSWPAGLGGAGPFGRVVAGNISDDAVTDVALIKGGSAVYAHDPGKLGSFLEIQSGVNDLDVIRGASPEGRGAVVVVDAVGLRGYWLADGATSFSSILIDSSAWAGATLVKAADLDGDGDDDVIGLAADGMTLLTCFANGPPGSFSPGPSRTLTSLVSAIEPIRWDADLPLEIACLTAVGVEIVQPNGTVIVVATNQVPGGVMTAIAETGRLHERLVWITKHANGINEVLVVVDRDGEETPITIAPLLSVGIEAIDVDQDGYEDVAVSGKISQALLIMFNQNDDPTASATFGFAAGEFALPPLTATPAMPDLLAEAEPAAGDYDGDGDLDLFCPVSANGTIAMVGNTKANASQQRPVLVDDEPFEYINLTPPVAGEIASGEARVDLVIDAPAAAPDATHIAFSVWRQDALGEDVVPVAVQTEWIATANLVYPVTIGLLLDEPTYPNEAIYSFDLRYVDLGPVGEIVTSYPSVTASFTVDDATTAALEISAQATGLRYSAALPSEHQQQHQHQSSLEIGALVELTGIDEFTVGTIATETEPPPP